MDTKKLRQTILDLAIHGKLVPQDPNDEPASVLLERIRAEKERLIAEGKIKRSKKSATSDTSHYENVPFDIPEGWCWSSIENVCSKFTTGPFGSMVHKSDYVTDGGVPMVNPANMIGGNISYNKLMFVSELRAKNLQKYRLEPSDILLARRGDLTKCVVIKNEQKDWLCGTGSFVLHTILLLPAYFELLYSSTYIQSILTSESVGATMDNLNQGLLGSIIIPIPPIEEQQRIVTSVGLWFSLINNLEFGYSELNQSIIKAKSKILDLAIHGKLVPQDTNDEPASELLKRINPKAVASCDNPHYENLPNGWAICSVKDIAQVITGSTPSKSNSLYYGNDVPFYKPNDLDCGRHVFSSTEYLSLEGKRISRVIPCNSISICCIGSIGKVGYIEKEGVTNQQINTIIPSSEINPLYIYYYCLSERFQQNIKNESSAVTIAIVNKSKLEKLSILLPPILEQRRIVEKIEQLMSSLDSIAETLG